MSAANGAPRAGARNSTRSPPSVLSNASNDSTEVTPLLARGADEQSDDETTANAAQSSSASSLGKPHKGQSSKSSKTSIRWPSIFALTLLCLIVVAILILGFLAPQVAEQYAMSAAVFEPSGFAIESFTETGAKARIRGEFVLDGSRVKKKSTRDLGRFFTWIASEVESKESQVEISLPEYGNIVLGTATVPPLKVSVRNGWWTSVDFVADVEPGSAKLMKMLIDDWIGDRLGQLRVTAKAKVALKSGLLSFGTQYIEQTRLFTGGTVPTVPGYDIKNITVHEMHPPEGDGGLAANVFVDVAALNLPIDFDIPPMGFGILVPNCEPDDPYIMLADAKSSSVHVHQNVNISLHATGYVRKIPDAFLSPCPGTHQSPLDGLLANYMHGKPATVYVTGSDSPSLETPQWITDIISAIMVPVPIPVRPIGHLIKNFTLADMHFGLPDSFAEPGTPESQPKISADIKALVALPHELTFPVNVEAIRAVADVYYHGKKFGFLDLHKWLAANSKAIPDPATNASDLLVTSKIDKAPVNITDEDVFTEVFMALLTAHQPVNLTVQAEVDVKANTTLGTFVARSIKAAGNVTVKPIRRGSFDMMGLKMGNLKIVDSDVDSMTVTALVNLTNPTKYSASIPYVDVHVLVNDTVMGHATVEDVDINPGNNTNIPVQMVWNPAGSGEKGKAVGKEWLSQYISGYNTSLTMKTHKGSIPAQPALGRALEALAIELPTPNLGSGDDDGNGDESDRPHFISDATVLSALVDFTSAL